MTRPLQPQTAGCGTVHARQEGRLADVAGGALAWMPSANGKACAMEAGRWWDAVRVTNPPGELALARLGGRTGAVIQDRWAVRLYWLIEPGAADGWPPMHQVAVLRAGHHVVIPPRGAMNRSDVCWCIPLLPGRYLTDADELRAALENRTAES